MSAPTPALYREWYTAHVTRREKEARRATGVATLVPALLGQFQCSLEREVANGWTRMAKCRTGLEALDRRGWQRSFHQKQFHEQFIRSCARVFWKTEKPGQFARDHKTILEYNGWESLPQEMLISTPRRFGKTISVSMFAAAMLFATPNVEVSIYSTCLRISHKLLRNISKFLDLIFTELGLKFYPVLSANMQELRLHGPEGPQDVRVVNSYPSKVGASPLFSANGPAAPQSSLPTTCSPTKSLCTTSVRSEEWMAL